MQKIIRSLTFALLLVFILNADARADSCRVYTNRMWLGADVKDPFIMAFPGEGAGVAIAEGVFRYNTGLNSAFQFTGGYHSYDLNRSAIQKEDMTAWWLSAGMFYRPAHEPDLRRVHLEVGATFVYNVTRYGYLATVTDLYGNTVQLYGSQRHFMQVLSAEAALVVKLSNRFNLRVYGGQGITLFNTPNGTNYIGGVGLVGGNFTAKAGVVLLFNLFPGGDCNRHAVEENAETESSAD